MRHASRGDALPVRWVGLRRDGLKIPLEVAWAQLPDEFGALWALSLFDVTARARIEDWFERMLEGGVDATVVVDEGGRILLVNQATERLLDERARRYIEYASEGAHRMQQLVADVLAYSRVESGAPPLARVSSEAIVRRLRHGLKSKIDEAGAVIEAGRLPPVLGDELQLEQLLQNLFANALKFRSQLAPRISVGAERLGSEEVFSVVDNGIGLDMQCAERIFKMFQRLNARDEYAGSGIGLTIAKRIVERHGGRIWVESALGEGCTFFFTLKPAPT